MIADLTALPWAGASLLDEATAAAEAMTLARRAAKKGHVFLADADCLPQTLAVLRTRAEPLGIHLLVAPVTAETIAGQPDLFGVLLPFPGASGVLRDPAPLIEAAHAQGALAAVAADLLALTLLRPPGEAGADIAVGSTQRFGVGLCAAGRAPATSRSATRWKRQLPGRLVGVSSADACGTAGPPTGSRWGSRAAHPAVEGDQQHLHGAGPAGGDRGYVCRLPRPGRASRHCPGCSP